MSRQLQGFLSFGDSDDDIAIQDSMTQVAGVEVLYSVDAGVPNDPIIDGDGWSPDGGDARLYNVGVNLANNQRLFDECHISFEVDTAFIDFDFTSSNQYLISGTQMLLLKSVSGYLQLTYLGSSSSGRLVLSANGKESKTRFDIVARRGIVDIYVDFLLVSRGPVGSHASGRSNLDLLYAGGLRTTNGDWSGYKIKNYQLSFRNQKFPISNEYGSIGFIGDSFITGGSFPVWASLPLGAHNPIDPGYGFNNSDIPLTLGGSFRDAGQLPTLFRELSKNGIWTENNKNYARSGASINSGALAAKQTEMLLISGYRPKVIYNCSGANDAAAVSSHATVQANYETQIKAMLTEANSKGVKHYVMQTSASLRADPTYQTKAFDDHLAALNAITVTLKDWSISQGHTMNVHIADNFNNFGGHNLDLSDFADANIHPNTQGSQKIGKWMAEALLGN